MDPRRYPSIIAGITALMAQACGEAASDNTPQVSYAAAGSAGQSEGGTSAGGSAGAPHVPTETGGSSMLPGLCAADDAPFHDQVITQIGAQRVFYSWTTDEQVAELRAGTELFSRSERAGQGRGLLFTELAALGQADSTPRAQLADALANDVFAKARFAWPNPWATLLGFPGESYGNQLLKIELEADAWIAVFDRGTLNVFDQSNQVVPLDSALAAPHRIGAIFYQSRGDSNAASCGTFSQGGVGFREFALGNLTMVKRWSLATAEIGERLKSDIAELQAFEKQLACIGDTSGWSSDVSCSWEYGYPGGSTRTNYDFSIALPSELYRPSATNLEALIATLEASMPTGAPLDVTPAH